MPDSVAMGNPKVKIVHHHVFKCAGSTLTWILERNFPSGVLYIEGPRNSSSIRITCDQVRPYIADNSYQAVSSHVLAIPKLGGNIGEVHFSLLRDPIQRVLSAYRFHKKRKDIREDMSINEFVEKNLQADNFQARHSSMPALSTGDVGWQIDDRIYDKIESGEIIFGLVEYFDHSMLLLEAIAKERGFAFDGAYPRKLNTTDSADADIVIGDELRALCAHRNALDFKLYETVKQRILPVFKARFTESDLQEFTTRCGRLRNDEEAKKIQVPAAKEWFHVEVESLGGSK
jgi:hypothetical protein